MSALERFEHVTERETLANALRVLRSRWLIVAGVVVACVLVAVARYERTAKTYKATASVSFQSGSLSAAALQISTGGSTEPQREADTEVLIAHSPEVAQSVRAQLGLNVPVAKLLDQVTVEAAPNANILEIVASTGDPRYSAQLANAFATQYIAFKARTALSGIESAQRKLERELAGLAPGSAERADLQQSLQRLSALRAVVGGSANVIGTAGVPKSPSGTKLSTTVIIGLLLGLGIALSIVFLLESLDRRIKSIEEVEREYRLPALVGVPQAAFRSPLASERGEQLEPYRILRSALDFAAVTRQLDTLLVTSAVSGEGKTTVAVDLSQAVALAGRRVVLMELDLRAPTFTSHFRMDLREGFTTALTRNAPLSELLVEPFPHLPNFSVLPAGRLPHNPAELLDVPRTAEMILELLAPDGMVVIDAPPLNPVADAQVLLNNSAIQGAIIVARVGKTTRDEARRARAILDRHAVDPVGVVVTGMRDHSRYGYEAYGPAAPADDGRVRVPAPRDSAWRGLST